ncbi:MAG: hypothetical protein M1816_005248 [Peltula sp. TS41687]|nr:MAG: hypothetical protein M1816_005248 [Peltula sp. TS41687]
MCGRMNPVNIYEDDARPSANDPVKKLRSSLQKHAAREGITYDDVLTLNIEHFLALEPADIDADDVAIHRGKLLLQLLFIEARRLRRIVRVPLRTCVNAA